MTLDGKALLDFWTPERRDEIQAAWLRSFDLSDPERLKAATFDRDERDAIVRYS